MARRRKQWGDDAYNPLIPFPNSEACQLSWSARWFSKFEARVMSSIPMGTSLHSFFKLALFSYFSHILIFCIYFNSFPYFIYALKNHQKLIFFLHYFHKMLI